MYSKIIDIKRMRVKTCFGFHLLCPINLLNVVMISPFQFLDIIKIVSCSFQLQEWPHTTAAHFEPVMMQTANETSEISKKIFIFRDRLILKKVERKQMQNDAIRDEYEINPNNECG